MAEVLNEYFSSVFTTEDISSLPVPFPKFEGNKSEHLGQLFANPVMIANKIKKMKDNKSPGVDGIPPKLLKQISTPLAKLQCGLTTLETRRLRGDQIEVFKIVNCYEDVDRNMFVKFKEGSRTRGHEAALVKEQCRLDMRKYSFSQRVINEWNKLPNDCVNTSSVNMLKNRIDRYLIRVGYTQMRKLLDSR